MLTVIPPVAAVDTRRIRANMQHARSRTLELIEGLSDEQLMGPRLSIVNPMLWEIGHVAWFHEHFILQRTYGEPPIMDGSHALYDSIAINHEQRWRAVSATLMMNSSQGDHARISSYPRSSY